MEHVTEKRTVGYRCYECNEPADHDHHVVPFSLGGSRTIPLCEACHGKVHGIGWKDHAELISRGIQRTRRANPDMPWGRVPIEQANPGLVAKIAELRAQGVGMKVIAKRVGVSSRTVWRLCQPA